MSKSHSEDMASNYNEPYRSASCSRSRGILLQFCYHAPEIKESFYAKIRSARLSILR